MISVVEDREVRLSQIQNKEANAKIDTFVSAMLQKKQSASYYTEKRATDLVKAGKDIFLGKKAECFAAMILEKYYDFPHIKLDMEIRHGAGKGWDVDLPYGSVDPNYPNVHVKACNNVTRKFCNNDYSWTFQWKNKDDNFGTDDIFNSADELVALVYLEDNYSPAGIVKGLLPFSRIRPLLRDPQKDSLIGLKKCLYYKDLTNPQSVLSFE